MKRLKMFCVAFLFISTASLGSASGPALAADPIVLQAVVPTPVFVPIVAPVKNIYIPGFNQAAGGKITINLKGGPEVIPAESQVDAVRKGIIDMAFTWVSDYRHMVPVTAAMHLSPFAPWEEREKGVFDYWVRVHKKGGLQYLGRWAWDFQFNYHLRNKEVRTLADLKGLKMADPLYLDGIHKHFGMVPVGMSGTDFFTAMERGVIDGYVWSEFGKYPGWEKVTKYVLDEPWIEMDMAILMNTAKYDALPQDIKDLFEKYTSQFEHEAAAWYKEQVAKERAKYEAAGCVYLKLQKEEGKYLSEMALKIAWEEDVKPAVDAKTYEEVRAILLR